MNLVVLIAFIIGLAIAFGIPILVTNYFVNDTNLAAKIVFANIIVMFIVNKLIIGN